MSRNPLQQYFRQPKIFIDLPSKGAYTKPGTIHGEASNLPVFGMTGMDEIIMRTPDSLLSGESSVKVIESCVPNIKDAWELSTLDTDLIFTAIRIATYGNTLTLRKFCPKCNEENEYEINLSNVIDHFSSCKFDNKITLKDFAIKLQPLTYRQSTNFSIRNFSIQKQLAQCAHIKDDAERQNHINGIFKELGNIKYDLFSTVIESIELPNAVVNEKTYINEWINNCEADILDKIKDHIDKNKASWAIPNSVGKCEKCGHEFEIAVELDQSSFFEKA